MIRYIKHVGTANPSLITRITIVGGYYMGGGAIPGGWFHRAYRDKGFGWVPARVRVYFGEDYRAVEAKHIYDAERIKAEIVDDINNGGTR